MKNRIIKLSLGVAMLACSLATQAQISIKGQLKGLRNNWAIVYTYDPATEKSENDTMQFKNGKFSLSYPTDHLLQVVIYEMPEAGKRLTGGVGFYLLPNKPLTVNGTLEKYTLKGADIYNKVKAYEDGFAPYKQALDKVNDAYYKEMEGAKTDEQKKAVRDKYFPDMRKCSNAMREFALNYIKQHPDNEASCIALNNCKDFYAAYDVMTDRVRNCELALAYKRHKDFADRAKKIAEQEKKVASGTLAPDFTLKDLQGNDFSLSSLRGKYVMLDFWGSWCGWCIKALPQMKECYAKHKDSGKFEIVSIDCRDTEAKWKAAVEKHAMTWTQVKNEDKDDIPTLYGISGYPSFIIINPEGQIVKRFIGSSPEMYTYIDSLFQ